jgi:hypothetical protein
MDEDWSVLLSLLPTDWEELGRKTGAIARLRGFDSVGSVLRTLLMLLTAAGEGAIFAGPVWATARMFNGGEESGQS